MAGPSPDNNSRSIAPVFSRPSCYNSDGRMLLAPAAAAAGGAAAATAAAAASAAGAGRIINGSGSARLETAETT